MLYHEVESVGPEVHFLVHVEDRHAKHFSDDLASLVGTTASMIIAKLNNDFAISPIRCCSDFCATDAGAFGMADYVEATIDAIRTIQPRLASRAAEYELARRIPPDVVAELQRLGVFRMNTPKSHGGLELPLRDSLAIVSEIARVDGSLGWVCALNGFAPVHLGQLPRQTYDLIYRDGPDVKVAGSGIPGGTAEVVDGGYQVTGRWPFVSGCNHADWIGAFCVATRNGIAMQGPSEGMAAIRIVVLPAKNWQIEDTWFAEGLKGTGSHHIALKDVRVP